MIATTFWDTNFNIDRLNKVNFTTIDYPNNVRKPSLYFVYLVTGFF